MFGYIVKRLLLVIPTLWLISLVAFFLSKHTPQDNVVSILSLRGLDIEQQNSDVYDEVYNELGYHQPDFYFSFVPHYYPKASLNSFSDSRHRDLWKYLLKKGYREDQIQNVLTDMDPDQKIAFDQLLINPEAVEDRFFAELTPHSKFFLPSFRWHGSNNQYHQWLNQALYKDFGLSISDGKTALSKVSKALMWTLSFTLIDFVLSISLGLLIGIFLSMDPQARRQKILRQILYFFFAIPVFWLATMLLIYFTTEDYGRWTNIFPSVGIDIYPGESTFRQIILNFDKLILPIICLTLHSLAYISRMVENGINDELKKDYVLLAYSKGMSKSAIIRKQVLRNAMTPSITLFMSALAGAFSGSLVIEVIYGIPGMGRLMFNALSIADWNVVFCILMVLSLVTVLAYLLGDILYAYFNPKIRFSK